MTDNTKDTPRTPPTAPSGPSPAMLQLFQAGGDRLAGLKLVRKNMPRMFKPDQIAVGGVIIAELVDVVASPAKSVDSQLLWLRLESGKEFTFPLVGAIRQALGGDAKIPDGSDANKKRKLQEEQCKRYKGKILVLTREDDTVASQYKKRMFLFDVKVADKPVDWTKPQLTQGSV